MIGVGQAVDRASPANLARLIMLNVAALNVYSGPTHIPAHLTAGSPQFPSRYECLR